MIAIARHGERVRAVLPLTPAQAEMTLAEYEAHRCMTCGVSVAPDDEDRTPVKLIDTPFGPVCELEIMGEEIDSDC